jgi:GAF domain-containing protein
MESGGVRKSERASTTAGGPRVLVRTRAMPAPAGQHAQRRLSGPDRDRKSAIILVLLAMLLAALALVGAVGLKRVGVVQPADRLLLLLVFPGVALLAVVAGFAKRRPRSRGRSATGFASSGAVRRNRSPGRCAPAYEALVRVSDRLARATTMEAVLSAVTEVAARAVRTPVALFLVERSGQRLFLAGAHGVPEAVRRVWPAVAVEGMDRFFEGRRLVVVSEVSTSQVPDREIHAAVGVRSAAFVQLEHRGERLGVMAALSLDEPRSFTADDLVVLRGIADQASQSVASAWVTARSERRHRLTQALRTIDQATVGGPSGPDVLDVVPGVVVDLLGADAATVLRLDPAGQLLRVAAASGFRTAGVKNYELRVHADRVGLAVLEERSIRIADLGVGTPDVTRTWLSQAEGLLCSVAIPLISNGSVEGVLEVFHRTEFEPDAEWSECAEAIAARTAIAIASVTLLERLRRANERLLFASDHALEGWSRALELRDHGTEGHTRRVTRLTLKLAAAAGMDGDDLVNARRGAILHDIGTMAVPESILQKPGSLTAAEWQVVRRHPRLALEMLEPIGFLGAAIDIPLCHHERWDGTGYPQGLDGEAIPLAARLFAVADVWDSLRSDRPYRAAWPPAEVHTCIRSLAGTHFDPRVVDLFERVQAA